MPAALAVVVPTWVVAIVITMVSPGWNPSPLTFSVLPAGPLVSDRKMFVSSLGGKLNGGIVTGGTVTVGPFPPPAGGSGSQTPIARQSGGPHTGEAMKPISATAIGTIHGTFDEPSAMTS